MKAAKEIFISSSLEGRELSLIKSILNIKSLYGNLKFRYTENSRKGAVLITKEISNNSEDYFAIIKMKQSSISIKPTINPKSLRSLFEQLGTTEFINFTKQEYATNSVPFFSQLYNFLNSEEHVYMQIKSKGCNSCFDSNTQFDGCINCNKFHIMLDKNLNVIYSEESFENKLLLKIINSDLKELNIQYFEEDNNGKIIKHKHVNDLLDLKWKLGLLIHESLFDKKYEAEEFSFKLVSWPDYGRFPFQKEFLQISSILSDNIMSYNAIIRLTEFHKTTINKFLNAACLSKHVVIISEKLNSKLKIKKNKDSKFIKVLKSFFSKISNDNNL